MKRQKFLIFMCLVLTLVALSWGIDQGWSQPPKNNKELKYRGGRVTLAEKKAAVKRAKARGLKPGVAGMYTATPAGLQPGGPELKGERK